MITELTPDHVKEILEAGNFDPLKGRFENYQVDCKKTAYTLTTLSQKRELAKDVSGFANASGGIIILGVKTKKSDTHSKDQIKTIHPFPEGNVNFDQCHKVLQSWIYPPVKNVQMNWYPSKKNPNEGIVAIEIPEQPSTQKPFLVTKTIEEGQANEKFNEILFGYVERHRDQIIPMSVQELQARLKDGLHFDSINDQLAELQEAIQSLQVNQGSPLESKQITDELLAPRIGLVLSELNLESTEPQFVLAATPFYPIKFPELFASRESKIVHHLEHPPEIRRSGYDLDTGGRAARMVEGGKRRRSLEIQYKTLNLWKDGTLIFASDPIPHILWRPFERVDAPFRINQLALIETTYLFAQLAKMVFDESETKPDKVMFRLELKNITVGNIPCALVPGIVGDDDWKFGSDIHRASDSTIKTKVIWESSDIDPGAISYQIICGVYEQFDMEHEKIPYTEKGKAGTGTNLVISPEEIRRCHAFS